MPIKIPVEFHKTRQADPEITVEDQRPKNSRDTEQEGGKGVVSW